MFLVIGMPYSWGVLSVYVRQYFNLAEGLNMSKEQVNLVFPISFATFFVGINAGQPIKKRIGSRGNNFVSSFGICLSLLLAGLCTNFYAIVLFFGVLLGFFCGIPYVPSLYICYQYFPQNKGLISGLCMMCFGFSAVVIQTIMVTIINPDNKPKNATGLYPEDVLNRVPLAIHAICAITLIISQLATQLIKGKKQLPPDLDDYQPLRKEVQVDTKTAYRSRFFYLLILMFSLSVSLGYGVLGNFKDFAVDMSDDYLNLVVGNLGAFSNGGFSFLFGFLYDRYKFKKIYNCMLLGNIFLAATMSFVTENKVGFALYVVLAAAIEGAHFAIFAPFTLESFGSENGAEIYSRVLVAILIGNFGEQLIFQFGYQFLGYQGIFLLFALFNIICVIILNPILPHYVIY